MVAEVGQCYKPAMTAEETDTPGGGAFVISLDFELMWGVRDKRTIADYGRNILGVRRAAGGAGAARFVRRAANRVHLGDGRIFVLRRQGRTHGVIAGTAAGLCRFPYLQMAAALPLMVQAARDAIAGKLQV